MTESDPGMRTLAQGLALLDDLRQAERRAVSSRVAAVIAHLIGTPLHVIAGRASLIRAAPTDASVAENARRIEEQVERLSRRIRGLIDYLTTPESAPTEDTADAVVSVALSLYGPVATERGVVLELAGDVPGRGSIPDADGSGGALTLDGTSALVVLTSLLSLATRIAPRGAVCSLAVSALDERQVLFELTVPGLEPPKSRLDTLEPPEGVQNERVEELQLLSVCSAIARRSGGSIEVVQATGESAKIRYTARVS
jgi:signal transduction histidine kinase